jgi:hypothetical protein
MAGLASVFVHVDEGRIVRDGNIYPGVTAASISCGPYRGLRACARRKWSNSA